MQAGTENNYITSSGLTENLNPLQGSTHTDPIINKNTEQVKTLGTDLSWHALNSVLQVKTRYHTEKQGFGYRGFQKKFQTHT